MAISASVRVSILIIFVIFSSSANTIMASSHGELVAMQRGLDSRRILRELTLELSNTKQRSRMAMADPDRVAPQGPDPQHH
ncbi:UNVERIFIED_CONTAM: hypothetical protein Sradi_5983800 [Sesamum radiatum]|uniref:Uncharacterized protein n=1 Tax=Sesamum radiatum TaxID=300843 RepID=A0AAW2KIC1_SESRA